MENEIENKTGNRKNFLATALFALFLGGLGIHRFYTGHIGIGVIQLLTGGGCGIWYLIDFFLICFGNFRDAEGNELEGYTRKAGLTVFFIWLGLVVLLTVLYFMLIAAVLASGLSQ